jgi:hypothetical protein
MVVEMTFIAARLGSTPISSRMGLGCHDRERAMRAPVGGIGKRITHRYAKSNGRWRTDNGNKSRTPHRLWVNCVGVCCELSRIMQEEWRQG